MRGYPNRSIVLLMNNAMNPVSEIVFAASLASLAMTRGGVEEMQKELVALRTANAAPGVVAQFEKLVELCELRALVAASAAKRAARAS